MEIQPDVVGVAGSAGEAAFPKNEMIAGVVQIRIDPERGVSGITDQYPGLVDFSHSSGRENRCGDGPAKDRFHSNACQ